MTNVYQVECILNKQHRQDTKKWLMFVNLSVAQ